MSDGETNQTVLDIIRLLRSIQVFISFNVRITYANLIASVEFGAVNVLLLGNHLSYEDSFLIYPLAHILDSAASVSGKESKGAGLMRNKKLKTALNGCYNNLDCLTMDWD
jgi:hypothetical protein